MERLVARMNPLAAKQARAVGLQDDYGVWPKCFAEQFTPEQVAQARDDPHLAEAERLFREIRQEGAGQLPPGALAITTYHLGQLLHRQGRFAEARTVYEDAITLCRLDLAPTDSVQWALSRALFRLAELVIREDRQRGQGLFAESLEISRARNDGPYLAMHQAAADYFGLPGPGGRV
jgi:tetratricopeptide (TPR) repeat protein